MPNYLEKKKKFNCIKIYRNLTNRSSLSIFKNNLNKLGKNIILSKSLKFFDEFKLLYKIALTLFVILKLKLIDKEVKSFFF